MLPVQLNKSRAAAARNLYGLAPEQLLGKQYIYYLIFILSVSAYASYIPRLPSYNNAGVLYPASMFFYLLLLYLGLKINI